MPSLGPTGYGPSLCWSCVHGAWAGVMGEALVGLAESRPGWTPWASSAGSCPSCVLLDVTPCTLVSGLVMLPSLVI